MTDTIPVEQVDRDAAADLIATQLGPSHGRHAGPDKARSGASDAGLMVQAFARHRLRARTEADQTAREALERLERIMRENIHENDGPDRIWLDGVAHEGPLATWTIRMFRRVGDIARAALTGSNSGADGGEG